LLAAGQRCLLADKPRPIAIPKITPMQILLYFGIEKDLATPQTKGAKEA
jgi:hypothetical protein